MSSLHLPRVLLVDDRLENLIAMESVLRPLPAELVRARSGNEALSILLREEFAVVLLDVQMPDMDGFEVATLMRSSPRTQDVPIIFLTAYGTEGRLISRGYAAGAVDFLFKPVDPDILKSKVDVFLRLYRQNRALAVLSELRHTQTELAWAKSDLEDFVRAASHDLREPVRTLSITLDLLEQKLGRKAEVEIRSDVRTLRQRAHQILSLLDALAEYARVGGEYDWTSTDLNEIVEVVSAELAEQIQAVRARIDVGELPTVEGHTGQIRSLLHHLLSNALKFRRTGIRPEIQILAEAVSPEEARSLSLDPEETYFALSVRDNGIGLREGDAKNLFRPFVHLVRHDSFEGGHLGLTICRRIVERHRGLILAVGHPGEGTTFRVVLPLRQGFTLDKEAGPE